MIIPLFDLLLTAIADRIDVAKKFIQALPAWVMRMFGIDVFRRWIKPAYDLDLDYYTFHFDEEQIWTGGWNTADDAQMNAVLQVDTPFLQFQFDNMALVQADDPSVLNPFVRNPHFNQTNTGNASLAHLSGASSAKSNPSDGYSALGDDLSTVKTQDGSLSGSAGSRSVMSAFATSMDSDEDTVKTGNTGDSPPFESQEGSHQPSAHHDNDVMDTESALGNPDVQSRDHYDGEAVSP